jgi:drug/metabolite transporter (DMT)-like permease
MLRVVIVMMLSALAAAGGQVMIRRGMQQIGALEIYEPLAILAYFGHAALNLFVVAGVGLNLIAFLLVITGLSWKDVTVVMPFAALEHLAVAVLAILLLQEAVSATRWAGIGLVVIGVMLISYSGHTSASNVSPAQQQPVEAPADPS